MGTSRRFAIELQPRIVQRLQSNPRCIKAHHRVFPKQREKLLPRLFAFAILRLVSETFEQSMLLVRRESGKARSWPACLVQPGDTLSKLRLDRGIAVDHKIDELGDAGVLRAWLRRMRADFCRRKNQVGKHFNRVVLIRIKKLRAINPIGYPDRSILVTCEFVSSPSAYLQREKPENVLAIPASVNVIALLFDSAPGQPLNSLLITRCCNHIHRQ